MYYFVGMYIFLSIKSEEIMSIRVLNSVYVNVHHIIKVIAITILLQL